MDSSGLQNNKGNVKKKMKKETTLYHCSCPHACSGSPFTAGVEEGDPLAGLQPGGFWCRDVIKLVLSAYSSYSCQTGSGEQGGRATV